jgi:hypothetical protein
VDHFKEENGCHKYRFGRNEEAQGRANYEDWCTAMDYYLELEDLWEAVIVEGTETKAKKI